MDEAAEDWLALLERVRKGDRVALVRSTTLITSYLTRLGAYDFRDSWDDVCQEVMVKLLRSAEDGTVRNPRAFVGYAGTVTHNTLVDWIRKNAKPGRMELPSGEAAATGNFEELGARLQSQRDLDLLVELDRAISRLSEVQRRVLHAVYLEGRSYEDAASYLGMPLGTLKRHQTQGLRELRERMGVGAGAP